MCRSNPGRFLWFHLPRHERWILVTCCDENKTSYPLLLFSYHENFGGSHQFNGKHLGCVTTATRFFHLPKPNWVSPVCPGTPGSLTLAEKPPRMFGHNTTTCKPIIILPASPAQGWGWLTLKCTTYMLHFLASVMCHFLRNGGKSCSISPLTSKNFDTGQCIISAHVRLEKTFLWLKNHVHFRFKSKVITKLRWETVIKGFWRLFGSLTHSHVTN